MLKTIAYLGLVLAGFGLSRAVAPVASADTVLPAVSVHSYFVTSSLQFPSLPLSSKSLVFLNGLFQTPGFDYDLIGGSSLRFRAGVLSDGDRIAVVTLP